MRNGVSTRYVNFTFFRQDIFADTKIPCLLSTSAEAISAQGVKATYNCLNFLWPNRLIWIIWMAKTIALKVVKKSLELQLQCVNFQPLFEEHVHGLPRAVCPSFCFKLTLLWPHTKKLRIKNYPKLGARLPEKISGYAPGNAQCSNSWPFYRKVSDLYYTQGALWASYCVSNWSIF